MSAITVDDRGIIGSCPHCDQKNRTPFANVHEQGKCGRCGQTLPRVTAPMEIPNETVFNRLIQEASLPVVIDFWAPWCGPCRMVAPELEKVAAANAGRWIVGKINTEALPNVGARFQIQSIPTMAVFHKGREVGRTMGARPAAAITEYVNETLRPTPEK